MIFYVLHTRRVFTAGSIKNAYMKSIDDCPQLASGVYKMLRALRRRIRWYVWAEGIANNLAWLGTAFWLSLAIDWFFEPSVPVRVLLFSAAMGVLMVIF